MPTPLPDPLPNNFDKLEAIIARYEQEAAPLKKGAEATIIWQDKNKKQKTGYAIVYLHGFKGSHPEGHPVHTTIAKTFECNLYLSRLYGHGQIKAKKFDDITPQKLIQSAEEACRIGKRIGKKVILMGCSTGALLAMYLAAQSKYKSSIAGLVLYSPLIHLYGIHSLLLENKCGRRLLRLFPGKTYQIRSADPFSPNEKNIWYRSYQLNGALMLGELIQQLVSPDLLENVQCPTFIGYYYKNKHKHDRIISTSAIKRAAQKLSTPPSSLVVKNFTDANSHVICSSLLSDAVQDVISATQNFLTNQFALKSTLGNLNT